MIHDGVTGLMGAPQRESLTLEVIAASAGIFLLVGLWTPIAGAVVAGPPNPLPTENHWVRKFGIGLSYTLPTP